MEICSDRLVPRPAPGTFDLLAFSRVAFSRDHQQALFAVSDACAYGDCGSGGAVYAHKDGGKMDVQIYWLPLAVLKLRQPGG
jgi:hypothetical protein